MEYPKKKILVWLLFFSCTTALIFFLNSEPPKKKYLRSISQIDSLITLTLDQHQLTSNQVSVRTVEIDSLFSRRIYQIEIPATFSKTSFHYALHQNIWPYEARTVAQVQFPERNLRIHVLVNNTVHRSLFIESN